MAILILYGLEIETKKTDDVLSKIRKWPYVKYVKKGCLISESYVLGNHIIVAECYSQGQIKELNSFIKAVDGIKSCYAYKSRDVDS